MTNRMNRRELLPCLADKDTQVLSQSKRCSKLITVWVQHIDVNLRAQNKKGPKYSCCIQFTPHTTH